MKTDILTFMKTLAILFFITSLSFSQNLVPNPSFEEYAQCPEFPSEIIKAIGWSQPTLGTPDYFNSCDISGNNEIDVPLNFQGYQYAKNGESYAGLFCAYFSLGGEYYREYLQIKLVEPLINDTKYYVSFFVSLSDSSNWATDDIGIYLSTDSIYSEEYSNLEFQPQIENLSGNFIVDKANWIPIKGEFIAQGGEKYLTIGNFKNNDNTDTIPVSGGGLIQGTDYYSYYYIDDVCVSSDSAICFSELYLDENVFSSKVQIFPNPATELIQIKTDYNSISDLIITDIYGNLLFKDTISPLFEINCSNWYSGIYFVTIKNKQNNLNQKIIIKH